MKPQALVDGILVETDGARVILTRADGERFSLPAVMAAVWRAADGRTDVAGLVAAARTVDPAADTQTVWAAIDALTDDGLMRRVAPPVAGLDRRMALRGLAAAAAAVVAVPAIARAEQAQAEAPGGDKFKSANKKEQQTKDFIKARLATAQADEQKVKADLQAAEVRAKEEEAKVGSAPPADVAARKRSEEEAKVQVTALRKKADAAKEQVMKASEETEKKAPAR